MGYYDVVCSVYQTEKNNADIRVDNYLICGGFETDDEALDYINTHNDRCHKYDDYCSTNEYCEIEIEQHNSDGSIAGVITVD